MGFVLFCRSLFVILSFFCHFLYIRLLITPLVSSNFSCRVWRAHLNKLSASICGQTVPLSFSFSLYSYGTVVIQNPITDNKIYISERIGHRGRDRMVVGFTTTYAISAYHHCCCGFESRSGRGVQQYVIKFVSNLRQVGGFLRVLRFPPPIKVTNWNSVESGVKHHQTNKQT